MEHQDILDRVKKVHFVGIGGSGMCPLAEILFQKGFQLTGSDTAESDTLARIRSYGIPVFMGQRAENIGDAELVVYTAAVKQDNPELVAARAKNIPVIERSVMLGIVTRRYANSIAVSGTHGKTTTTAMITQVCLENGADPTSIIGGKLPLLGGNSCIGKSETIVCEACEYVDTFLQLTPAISIILNIDNDHLDYFKTVDHIIDSFRRFAQQTQKVLIVNGDDANTLKAVNGLTHAKLITFGLNPSNDYYAENIRDGQYGRKAFALMRRGEKLAEISLSIPGRHNIYNALATAALADYLGIAPSAAAESIHHFTGVHRRFEILGTFGGVTVADDFAHHPTELKATLKAAMDMGFHEVWAIFQPHTYSRTRLLMNDFADALSIPQHVILSEILAVRETNTYGVYSKDLAEKIPGCVWFPAFPEIAEYAVAHARPGDLILTLGGGDVYKCANMIVEKYRSRQDTK